MKRQDTGHRASLHLRQHLRQRQRQAGFSLLELAMGLVVLGLVTVLLVQFLQTASRGRTDVTSAHLLRRADDALLAYVMIHSRLPCPAVDGTGEEDCNAGQLGQLPYRSLGLPDANARRIRYGVLRRPDPADLFERDADLTRLVDRFHPLQVEGKSGGPFPLFNTNGMDLCWALRSAQAAPANAAFVHVTRPDAPAQIADNVAYALALPASGAAFTGQQAGNTAAFDSPRRPASAGYGDRVLAVGLDQLYARMRCGDHLAATGHAHFNAAASVSVMHAALTDYKSQLEISESMAKATVLSAEAGIASGVAGGLKAGAGMTDAIAESLASFGSTSYRIAVASAAIASAVAATSSATATLVVANRAKAKATRAHTDATAPIGRALALKADVSAHAATADDAGLY